MSSGEVLVGRRWAPTALVWLALALGGCATVGNAPPPKHDPWERMNRRVFEFNETVDQVAIKPAAQVYQKLVPQLVRRGVSNVFGNIGDAWTSVNLLLQVKPRQGLEMGMRTMVNTVFGLGGVLDPAEEMGLERNGSEDFGQTLGYWGLKSGPYLVLPFLGPSTLRDTTALLLDIADSGPGLIWTEPRDRNAASVIQVLNTRVRLLNAGNLLDEIALDKYALLRDAYLARRRSLIYDGEAPDDPAAPAPYRKLLTSPRDQPLPVPAR